MTAHTIRPKTEREVALEELLVNTLETLRDLEGRHWDEVCIDLDAIWHDAARLGIEPEH